MIAVGSLIRRDLAETVAQLSNGCKGKVEYNGPRGTMVKVDIIKKIGNLDTPCFDGYLVSNQQCRIKVAWGL